VARVLQEAITNAIKHSGCDAIAVRAGLSETSGGVEISITDNGRGLQPGGAGHGLASMRRRSAALGGELLIDDASPGTRVTLRLPANRIAGDGQSPVQAQTGTRVARQS
jgi:signal transduction histidine kinase